MISLRHPCRHAVLAGSHAYLLLEQAGEVLRILEAEAVGYLAERQGVVEDVLLRQADDLALDVALGGLSRLALDEVAEIAGREVGLVGKVGHAGQAVALGVAADEVVAQMALEAGEDVAVHPFAGDELALVVAHAVVEQHADGIDDEWLGVLVDGVLQFHADLCEHTLDDALLRVGEVQGLALVIVEIGVLADALGQRCAVDEVGMEQYAQGLWSRAVLAEIDIDHLAGCEADDGAVLIVVLLPSVVHGAALAVLQEHGIDAVVYACLREASRSLR